jgi:hypothetical protein
MKLFSQRILYELGRLYIPVMMMHNALHCNFKITFVLQSVALSALIQVVCTDLVSIWNIAHGAPRNSFGSGFLWLQFLIRTWKTGFLEAFRVSVTL